MISNTLTAYKNNSEWIYKYSLLLTYIYNIYHTPLPVIASLQTCRRHKCIEWQTTFPTSQFGRCEGFLVSFSRQIHTHIIFHPCRVSGNYLEARLIMSASRRYTFYVSTSFYGITLWHRKLPEFLSILSRYFFLNDTLSRHDARRGDGYTAECFRRFVFYWSQNYRCYKLLY